jgi:hypothetical protein
VLLSITCFFFPVVSGELGKTSSLFSELSSSSSERLRFLLLLLSVG